jgi:hypothetical protein
VKKSSEADATLFVLHSMEVLNERDRTNQTESRVSRVRDGRARRKGKPAAAAVPATSAAVPAASTAAVPATSTATNIAFTTTAATAAATATSTATSAATSAAATGNARGVKPIRE